MFSGVLVLIGAGLIALDNILLPRLGMSADAVVTRLVRYSHGDEEGDHWDTYKPVLRFTADGTVYQRESNLEVDPGELSRGDVITVYYWAGKPEQALVPDAWLWFIPGLFFPIGLAFFSLGRFW